MASNSRSAIPQIVRESCRDFVAQIEENGELAEEAMNYWQTREARWGRVFPMDERQKAKVHEAYHAGWVDAVQSLRVILEDATMEHFAQLKQHHEQTPVS